MYRALYRKYRPLAFDSVVGQDHVVNTVKNQIANKKISHAYMFTGTRGTGKTTCAKILARAVNCENPINGDPCNECETCKGILNGSIMDVIEIDAASNNGVDNIRELREDVIFTPAMAKYKVYIIDEVHMLSTQAFNALLKTLEEPPAHVIFVFATTEINKVPKTILSRCQRFDFRRITVEDIKVRLDYVASKEQISIDADAAYLISRLSDGALRDALSILDRCINGTTGNITVKNVEQTVGLCSYEELSLAFEAISNNDTSAILEFYSNCRRNSKDAISLFSEMCSHFRDMIIVKLAKNVKSMLNYDEAHLKSIASVAEKFTLETILRAIGILQTGIYDVSKFKDKHIMAEVTLIKLTNPAIGGDYEDINARLSRLEVLGVSAPVSPPKKVSVKKQFVEETEVSAAVTEVLPENCEFWDKIAEIVSMLGGKNLSAVLKRATAQCEGNILYINCPNNEFDRLVISSPQNIELIKTAANRATSIDYVVRLREKKEVIQNSDDAFNEIINNANDILYKE